MIWNSKIFCCLLFLLTAIAALPAQNRSELEIRRKQLIEEIDQTNQLLTETKQNKATALDRFFALQTQIKRRQELITTLRKEISYADSSIVRANQVIEALNIDVSALKQEYAQMLRSSFRHKMNQSYILFLFSSRNFNDVFKRWRYIRQYDQFRKRQAFLITETQKTLENKLETLEEKKLEKQQLLTSEQNQKQLLTKELDSKNEILETLKADEKRLTAELSEQQKAHQKLNAAIETVIFDEMARKKKAARTPEALDNSRPTTESAINETALSENFQNSKGRLPWPVNSGVITRHFGAQTHPTQKRIKIVNNGIDIRTQEKAHIQVVFSGTVAGTQFIPGYQHTIIVQHGDYYTVYSNLEEIYVKRGDQLRARQKIGRLGSQNSEVHFEIWKEKERLNPVKWVSKPS